MSYLSPGVFVVEQDESAFVPNLATTIAGVVGTAQKGPIDTPTLITSALQFVQTFGAPNPSMFGPYAALQFLQEGSQLYYVRVAGPAAFQALLQIPSDEDGTNDSKAVMSSASGLFDTTGGDLIVHGQVRLATAAVLPDTPTYAGTPDFTLTGTGNTILSIDSTVTVAANRVLVKDQVDQTQNGIYVVTDAGATGGGGHPWILTRAADAQDDAGVIDDTFVQVNAGTVNAGTGWFQSTPTPTLDTSNLVFTSWDAMPVLHITTIDYSSGTEATATLDVPLIVATDLSASDVIDSITGAVGYGAANFVADEHPSGVVRLTQKTKGSQFGLAVVEENATVLGFDDDEHYGSDAKALPATIVGSAAGPFTLTGSNDTVVITEVDKRSGFTVNTARTVTLSHSDTSVDDVVEDLNTVLRAIPAKVIAYVSGGTIVLSTEGIENDLFGIKVSGNAANTLGLDIATTHYGALAKWLVQAVSPGSWGNIIEVFLDNGSVSGLRLRVYEDSVLQETWDNLSTDPTAPAYVETVINGKSALILVTDNVSLGNPPKKSTGTAPADVVALDFGNDDLAGVVDGSYIGTISDLGATGMQGFANPEVIDINILMVPGVSSADVINAGLDLCAVRNDAMMIVDPPLGLSAQNIIKWHNGQAPYDDHQAFDTSFGALYWPWLQIYDPVNNVKVWTPPSGNAARAWAFTDRTTETWFAPAGTVRGRLLTPLMLEHSATRGERDALYGNGNSVNPIINIPQTGITIYGQRTLQRTPTAEDRINVKRMLLFIEKSIATAERGLVFQPDDPISWAQLKDIATPFLLSVQARRGLVDFKIICDATTNTPDVIDRNEMHATFLIKPTKTAEFVILTFALTAQGANFATIRGF